jgi:hypothetical protein
LECHPIAITSRYGQNQELAPALGDPDEERTNWERDRQYNRIRYISVAIATHLRYTYLSLTYSSLFIILHTAFEKQQLGILDLSMISSRITQMVFSLLHILPHENKSIHMNFRTSLTSQTMVLISLSSQRMAFKFKGGPLSFLPP